MKPFLYSYLLFFGFLSSLQAQQNQTYFEKYDVKSRLLENSITITVKTYSGEFKTQILQTKDTGKEFDMLPDSRAATNLIITLPV